MNMKELEFIKIRIQEIVVYLKKQEYVKYD